MNSGTGIHNTSMRNGDSVDDHTDAPAGETIVCARPRAHQPVAALAAGTESLPTPRAQPAGSPSSRRPMRILRRTVSMVATVLVVSLACITIMMAVAARLSSDGKFNLFGRPAFVVLSGSMTPIIRTGDFILDDAVSPDAATQLHVGQIITFRERAGSSTILTHRIVGVDSKDGAVSYITKGDANPAADPVPRPASNVIGVFKQRIPRGGYVLTNLQRPSVLGLLLASPILWLVAGLLFEMARNLDETRSQEPAAAHGGTGPGGP